MPHSPDAALPANKNIAQTLTELSCLLLSGLWGLEQLLSKQKRRRQDGGWGFVDGEDPHAQL